MTSTHEIECPDCNGRGEVCAFTPDTNIHRLVMTALLLGIWALIIAIGGMG